MRGLALPRAAASLALAGNILLGFTAACVARTRTREPGAAADSAVVLVLIAPSLAPQVARWVHTFPAPDAGGPSPDPVWWTVLTVRAVAIASRPAAEGSPGGGLKSQSLDVRLCRTRPGIHGTYRAPHSARRQDDQPSQL